MLTIPAREATHHVHPRAMAPFWGAIASCVRLLPVQEVQSRTERKRFTQTKRMIFGMGVLIALAGYAHWGFLVAGVLVICASGLLPLTPAQATTWLRWLESKRWRTHTQWHVRELRHDGRRLMVYDDQGTMISRVLTNRSFKRFVEPEDSGHTYLELRPADSKKRSEAIGIVLPKAIASLPGVPRHTGHTRTAKLIIWIEEGVQDARLDDLLTRMS